MSETKTYKLDDNLTVEFEEQGAYITGAAISPNLAMVFLPWAALDALDDARYEHNLPFADLPPEGEK